MKDKGLPLFRLEGHEASVTAIAVDSLKIVTGGGDAVIIIWATETGRRLRRLHGHGAAITAMDIGPRWLLTASMDASAKVWSLPPDADPTGAATEASDEKQRSKAYQALSRLGNRSNSVRCSTTLRVGAALGSFETKQSNKLREKVTKEDEIYSGGIVVAQVIIEPGLTAIKYGSLEVIGGTASGEVVVWWLATGDVLTRSKVHNGPVKDIQFDATRVVSVAGDGVIAVTDVSTGDTLQSLRGHDGAILAVAFDTKQILTVGADNSIRQWPWTRQNNENNESTKLAKKRTLLSGEALFDYHALKADETLADLAQKYHVSASDLVQWNAIKNPSKDLKPGMQLVVFKRDPNQLTEAEAAAKTKTKRAIQRGDEAYEATKMRAMVAKRHAHILIAIQARRDAEDLAKKNAQAGTKQRHRDAFRLEPASAAARLAKSTDPTALDKDRLIEHRIKQRAHIVARESLAARLKNTIQEDNEQNHNDDDDDDLKNDNESILDPDHTILNTASNSQNDAANRLARNKALNKKETKKERQERLRAEHIFASFILPAVFRDELTQICEDSLRNKIWNESLAGRLSHVIPNKSPQRKKKRTKLPNINNKDKALTALTISSRPISAASSISESSKEDQSDSSLVGTISSTASRNHKRRQRRASFKRAKIAKQAELQKSPKVVLVDHNAAARNEIIKIASCPTPLE
uniref:LysM domain-containing protein n=1 Tax=Aureoumbra lagunensis TaxID=44058 RepID=A0A7S3JSW7_9STRA